MLDTLLHELQSALPEAAAIKAASIIASFSGSTVTCAGKRNAVDPLKNDSHSVTVTIYNYVTVTKWVIHHEQQISNNPPQAQTGQASIQRHDRRNERRQAPA